MTGIHMTYLTRKCECGEQFEIKSNEKFKDKCPDCFMAEKKDREARFLAAAEAQARALERIAAALEGRKKPADLWN